MKRKVQLLVGLALAALLIWWMFSGTNWAEVWFAIRSADLFYLGIATAAIFLSFFVRIQRWSYIVRTAGPVSFRTMFSATQIGFLANYILPARLGEFVRALALSHLSGLNVSRCIAFVALDRLTDLFGLMAVLMVSLVAFQPTERIVLPPDIDFPSFATALLEPQTIRHGAMGTIVLMLLLIAVMVVVYLNQHLALRLVDVLVGKVSPKFAAKLRNLIEQFAEGLHVFRSSRDMLLSLFFSLVTWGLFAVSYHTILVAFHLNPPWYAAFILLALLSAAISLPGAPGFVGQFHAAVFAAIFITMPATSSDVARATAIMAHLLNLVPIVLVGLYCLYLEKIGFIALEREGKQMKQADQDPNTQE